MSSGKMRAMVLSSRGPVEAAPLTLTDVPVPEPGPGEVLVRVSVCGICRTDLHVIEGELAPRLSPLIPGHQIVGVVEHCAAGADFALGARVGIAWLHDTCGECGLCRTGRENLCDRAHFTGHSVNGGFAEFTTARGRLCIRFQMVSAICRPLHCCARVLSAFAVSVPLASGGE